MLTNNSILNSSEDVIPSNHAISDELAMGHAQVNIIKLACIKIFLGAKQIYNGAETANGLVFQQTRTFSPSKDFPYTVETFQQINTIVVADTGKQCVNKMLRANMYFITNIVLIFKHCNWNSKYNNDDTIYF